MSKSSVQINCLISGHTENQVAKVHISPDETVLNLAAANWQKLLDTKVKDIQLVKVLLPPGEASRVASDPSLLKSAGPVLSDVTLIKDAFTGADLQSGMVHVLVLPPGSDDPNPSWLYRNAWGKKWPQRQGTVFRRDTLPASVSQSSEAMDIDDSNQDAENIELEYNCLLEMDRVAKAISSPIEKHNSLLILKEYPELATAIASYKATGANAVLVTGQRGIGKSAFLLYLLLQRLEHRQPTAVQFTHNEYIIFDEEGPTTVDLTRAPLPMERRRLSKCDALTDSNTNLIAPSDPFLNTPELLVQTSSPRGEGSHEWVIQMGPRKVILDLPSPLEIVAIIKESGRYDTRNVFHLVNKWGPCTRTILRIMAGNDQGAEPEVELRRDAVRAAEDIWASPSTFFRRGQEMLDGHCSTLVFIRPKTPLSNIALYSIPTVDLKELFDAQAATLEKKETFALFTAFSSHSHTRTAAGWAYEQIVHKHLSSGGEALHISSAGSDKSRLMKPSTNLLPGTEAILKRTTPGTAFYWMPSIPNFPGIDSVLANDNQIYVLQATIATDHTSPVKGLEDIFGKLKKLQPPHCQWHYVIIGQDKSTVENLAAKASRQLQNGTDNLKNMGVWVCVLSGDV
ncbi:hypothetical protein DFP72DRAFT_852446 [Ephemerocybe angulata]|uniref:Uncharacterized protein n=1 Tax=Ephemerocybe angulata TaxID=980116 RepID=A0A8H6M1A3_9AGAR|nr:hypothetical protein DFP72DRAFT_852446 [Tulosesus angulatus]